MSIFLERSTSAEREFQRVVLHAFRRELSTCGVASHPGFDTINSVEAGVCTENLIRMDEVRESPNLSR